ncbi:MAG: GNAT family N-acetyltransferase, partial [Gemmobacter sp.]
VTCDRMQRRGIGRAVLTRILAAARGAGIRRIGALATRGAVPFYAVMGFVEGPEVAVPLAPGVAFPAVQMMRQI